MITSLNSLSVKRQINSPNKINNTNLYTQFILQSNKKYLTQNKSNPLLTEKNIIIEKSLNSLRNINKNDSNSFPSNNNPKNENKYSYDNNDNITNIKINIKKIKKSISKYNSNTNSNEILNPRFITLVNKIQKNRNNRIKSPKSINKLPKITRKILLN